MRNAFAAALSEAALRDPRIYVVVADISPAGPMVEFAKRHPERFINVGVAEQSMIGFAAGLALKGLRPFCYTIATFALYRPFEFVRNDLAYQKLPVTVVGMGAGVMYSTLGGTHHAQEDVAIAGAIPGMQVIAPCDPLETKSAVQYAAVQGNGPLYLRIGKAGEPSLTDEAEAWEFGKVRYLRRRNTGICLIGYGPILSKAMKALPESTIVSCHTMKPLDELGLVDVMMAHRRVIVIEEHVPYLSIRMKELAFDSDLQCNIESHALKDEFIHNYGTHEDLLRAHGMPV